MVSYFTNQIYGDFLFEQITRKIDHKMHKQRTSYELILTFYISKIINYSSAKYRIYLIFDGNLMTDAFKKTKSVRRESFLKIA
jgi:hypothetical protein